MAALHTLLGWPLAAVTFVVGSWCLVANWVPALRRHELWIAIAVAQAAVFAQAFLGVVALSGFDGPRPDMHIFYGFLAMLSVGILYAYRSYEGLNEHRYVLYGLGNLFIFGLLVRAITLQPETLAFVQPETLAFVQPETLALVQPELAALAVFG